MVYFSYN